MASPNPPCLAGYGHPQPGERVSLRPAGSVLRLPSPRLRFPRLWAGFRLRAPAALRPYSGSSTLTPAKRLNFGFASFGLASLDSARDLRFAPTESPLPFDSAQGLRRCDRTGGASRTSSGLRPTFAAGASAGRQCGTNVPRCIWHGFPRLRSLRRTISGQAGQAVHVSRALLNGAVAARDRSGATRASIAPTGVGISPAGSRCPSAILRVFDAHACKAAQPSRSNSLSLR